MNVTYRGPHAAVTVTLPDGSTATAKRGEPVQVPQEVGAELTRRTSWSEHKDKPAKAKRGGDKPAQTNEES